MSQTDIAAHRRSAIMAFCYHRAGRCCRSWEVSDIVSCFFYLPLRRFSLVARHALLVSLLLCLPLGVAAATEESGIVKQDSGEFTINLRDADIRAFISSVADITGQNFVVDPRVKGNVTVISSAPTDAKALYDVFLSILKVHGFAAIPSGDVVKIVPDATAKQEGQDTPSSFVARNNDALVTAVIPVRHVSAPELVAVLRPLLPQEAHLAGFAASNVLVVADSGVNVRRMMRIVAQLDTASDKTTQLYELKNADAEDVVRILNSLTTDAGKQQSPGISGPQFIAVERTNTVVMQAAPNDVGRYRRLIDALDVPDNGPEGVEVVPLHFATAADLLPVLQGVLTGENMAPQDSGNNSGGGAPARPEGVAAAASTTPGSANIQADEATNTLIIQAPARQMKTLRDVITKLDVRRNQVLVEGIIAELSTSRGTELGIQWQTSQTKNGVLVGSQLPGTVSGGIEQAVNAGNVALLNGLTFGYMRGGDIRTLLRAISGDSYTNILSTPTLMTLDNAEAEIVVGQNVPFVTGSFTNSNSDSNNPFQTIERKDIGVLLKVKPQINEGGTVTLELEQEVSSVAPNTNGNVDLITNKRSIKTTVLVDNGEIVVLGGLIENKLTENNQKIPWVGDIPLLGHLFKNSLDDARKTNLMVFLRPTIVNDREGNRSTAASRYDMMRGRQEAQEPRRRGSLLHQDAPRLPAPDGLLE